MELADLWNDASTKVMKVDPILGDFLAEVSHDKDLMTSYGTTIGLLNLYLKDFKNSEIKVFTPDEFLTKTTIL